MTALQSQEGEPAQALLHQQRADAPPLVGGKDRERRKRDCRDVAAVHLDGDRAEQHVADDLADGGDGDQRQIGREAPARRRASTRRPSAGPRRPRRGRDGSPPRRRVARRGPRGHARRATHHRRDRHAVGHDARGVDPDACKIGRRCCPRGHVPARVATPHAGSTPATLVARGLLLVAPMMTRIGGWRGVVVGAAFTLLVAGLQAVGRARGRRPPAPASLPAMAETSRPRVPTRATWSGVDGTRPGPRRSARVAARRALSRRAGLAPMPVA